MDVASGWSSFQWSSHKRIMPETRPETGVVNPIKTTQYDSPTNTNTSTTERDPNRVAMTPSPQNQSLAQRIMAISSPQQALLHTDHGRETLVISTGTAQRVRNRVRTQRMIPSRPEHSPRQEMLHTDHGLETLATSTGTAQRDHNCAAVSSFSDSVQQSEHSPQQEMLTKPITQDPSHCSPRWLWQRWKEWPWAKVAEEQHQQPLQTNQQSDLSHEQIPTDSATHNAGAVTTATLPVAANSW